MSDFLFDEIDPGRPPALTDGDRVIFHGGPAQLASVTYAAASGGSVTTVSFRGQTVTFDAGIQVVAANHDLLFDDGSWLLIGGAGSDLLVAGDGDDGLYGGSGDDTLSAGAGDNLVQGNQGDDSLAAAGGSDTIHGGQHNDVIRFTGGADATGDFGHGNLGDDTIQAGSGADTLLGGQGNDLIFGGGGSDVLNGNLGDDTLVIDGPATAFGEGGADTLGVRARGAVLSGGDGLDTFAFDIAATQPPSVPDATISDWTGADRIVFARVQLDHAYAEISAADFASARADAGRLIATATDPRREGGSIVVAQVGGDLIVFAANAGSPDADYAVRIVGRALADIEAGDFTLGWPL